MKDLRILVVDDFPAMRALVRNLLRELGFSAIEEAADGQTALEKLRAGGFGLLITDWKMPGMDGIALLSALREETATAGLPAIMLSSETRRDRVREAEEAGASAYLVKPCTAGALGRVLGELSLL
jgi:two-component system chemotaxis response regulator CheY